MTKAAKKRTGRPKKKSTPAARVHLGLRVTPGMKQQLEAAAARTGRSLSQEVELRLERSLDMGRHIVLSRGDYWSPLLIADKKIYAWLGDDPRDPHPGMDPPHQEHLVELKISEHDLMRLWNYLNGAPWPWTKSRSQIDAEAEEAGDSWQQQEDIKRGK